MKCLLCRAISLKIICQNCQNEINLSPNKRVLLDGFCVYSFFEYQSIELLLKSKYSLIGSRIYEILAKKAHKYFKSAVAGNFDGVYGIGIDDRIRDFYSHSGVIVNAFKPSFRPLFGALIARNEIHYAGKSLSFRQENKKDFIYRGKRGIKAVLIDDIITTGESIKQAREVLKNHDIEVLFALTLCDARF